LERNVTASFLCRSAIAAALGLLLAAGAAAACGGDDDDADPTAAAGTSSARARTPTAGTPLPAGSARPGSPVSSATPAPALREALGVLTAVAGGAQVPAPTLAAAQTQVAIATLAPPPPTAAVGTSATPAPGATERPRPAAAQLVIDADPGNDGGPCNSIDTSRSVANATEFNVAVCLESADRAPVNGNLTSLQLDLTHGPNIEGIPAAGDPLLGLDGNPDFLEGPAVGGDDWDCNALDDAVSAPRAAPLPVRLVCATTDFQANDTQGATVPLAIIRFRSGATGTTELEFSNAAGFIHSSDEALCGDGTAECASASIEVR
jgi:hypothetical protein